MAIVTGGINGPFKGKVGSIIGYQLNGQNIIKGLPRKSAKNKRGSVAQKASRSKFTKIQRFLKPILPFIQVGFNMEGRSRQLSAHNAAKSYNLLNAFTVEGELDYSKVLVAHGNLPSPLSVQTATDDVGIHFSWTNNADSNGIYRDDQVMLLVYNVKEGFSYFMLSGARRKAERETFEMWEGNKGKKFHTWIAFISDDRQQISMSTYTGEVVRS
ncbi:MAG TPA: DUF6266 family protein [Pedobacter sp.]|nr:DUF6266 family protein [Pedobacter sp.]